jgi:hypothetical protein
MRSSRLQQVLIGAIGLLIGFVPFLGRSYVQAAAPVQQITNQPYEVQLAP